jgi:hypothetical protein
MIGARLGELGVKRLDDIRIGRSGLGDLQGAETVLRGHKVHEVGVDGVGDVDEELIRSAAIDGGKRSMWVIICRAGLNFRRPLHPRKLPRLSPTGVAASHRPENPKSTATRTVATAGMPNAPI